MNLIHHLIIEGNTNLELNRINIWNKIALTFFYKKKEIFYNIMPYLKQYQIILSLLKITWNYPFWNYFPLFSFPLLDIKLKVCQNLAQTPSEKEIPLIIEQFQYEKTQLHRGINEYRKIKEKISWTASV